MGDTNPSTTLQTPSLPVENATIPFWRTTPDELDTYRTTEDLPTECDILIIGGGYAGIAAAYHLLASEKAKSRKDQENLKVVLVEAREACSGATGRNGGHIRPSVHTRLPALIREYGVEAAAELCAFEDRHVKALAELVEKEGIECDFVVTRSFDIHTNREDAEAAKKTFGVMKERGVALSTLEGLVWTDEEDAEKVSQAKGCVGCFSFPAAHLWPYKLMMELLKLSNKTGQLNIQTKAPVTSLQASQTKPGEWTAQTLRGPITAKKIIMATNGYTSTLLPEYSGKIVPCRGICCHITAPEGAKVPEMADTYCLRLPKGSHDYLMSRPDGSIIVGGARADFLPLREEWYNNTDDATLIQPAKSYFDTYMQDHFVGWENSGAKVESIWTGIMGYNSDGLPSVGEVPGKKGVWISAGFDGHGMPVIWLTMEGLADMVMDGTSFEDSGIPRIYKTTAERLESERDDYALPRA